MNQETKEKWIAALRSGEYQQMFGRSNNTISWTGRHSGEKVTNRCCLNVGAYVVAGNKADSMGTEDSTECLGLPTETANILINMNDEHMCSFFEISHWIEENIDAKEN